MKPLLQLLLSLNKMYNFPFHDCKNKSTRTNILKSAVWFIESGSWEYLVLNEIRYNLHTVDYR